MNRVDLSRSRSKFKEFKQLTPKRVPISNLTAAQLESSKTKPKKKLTGLSKKEAIKLLSKILRIDDNEASRSKSLHRHRGLEQSSSLNFRLESIQIPHATSSNIVNED